MPDWPSSLPSIPLVAGYTEELPRTTITTAMDAGPAKTRRRLTNNVSKHNINLTLNETEVAAFKSFYETDILGGSLEFTFNDPITQTPSNFRFDLSSANPTIAAIEPGIYSLSAVIEKMP